MSQALWNFAVACYERSGVARLCLALQDEHGADVCLLLAALWLESRGVAPAPARVAALRDLAEPWQRTVIAPLRQLRRAWKALAAGDPALAELRGRLAELELQAEHRLLERIEALAAGWPQDTASTAGAWLEALVPDQRDALQALRAALGPPPQS